MNPRDMKELLKTIPHDTLAGVRKVGSRIFVLRADNGEDITKHVPARIRDKALEKGKGLRFIHTAAGGFQWRNHDNDKIQTNMDDNGITWDSATMKNDSRTN